MVRGQMLDLLERKVDVDVEGDDGEGGSHEAAALSRLMMVGLSLGSTCCVSAAPPSPR